MFETTRDPHIHTTRHGRGSGLTEAVRQVNPDSYVDFAFLSRPYLLLLLLLLPSVSNDEVVVAVSSRYLVSAEVRTSWLAKVDLFESADGTER